MSDTTTVGPYRSLTYAAEYLDLHRITFSRLFVQTGRIRVARIGRRVLVPQAELERLAAELLEESCAPEPA